MLLTLDNFFKHLMFYTCTPINLKILSRGNSFIEWECLSVVSGEFVVLGGDWWLLVIICGDSWQSLVVIDCLVEVLNCVFQILLILHSFGVFFSFPHFVFSNCAFSSAIQFFFFKKKLKILFLFIHITFHFYVVYKNIYKILITF